MVRVRSASAVLAAEPTSEVPGRTQVNMLETRKREHSRKPDEQYEIIEACWSGPYLELFARGERKRWSVWANQADADYAPTWKTYAYNSMMAAK